MGPKNFPHKKARAFFFLSTQTILCCGLSYCLLQIQILSIYCSWFLCVIRKLKFAAGPFILANHADIKSLKALRVAPAGSPLSTSLLQDIVLVFSAHASWVLSPCCSQPQHWTVTHHFTVPRPTPTGNRSDPEPCHLLEISPLRVTGVCPASGDGGDTYPHTRSCGCVSTSLP